MGELDQQCILAVETLHELGLAWQVGMRRKAPDTKAGSVADGRHALLVRWADDPAGCSKDSPKETELATIIKAIAIGEEKRWPLGQVAGGKG